jgi:transcriptional regulator with XRE-family HTH domain
MSISEKIKYFRTAHKMSREKLSELSGISLSTIRKYESGERKPKADQLLKLADALGISINTLLDFDIKTVSDLLSLIFKMDEQVDMKMEIERDDTGTYDAGSIRLSFANDTVNQKLLSYILACQKREEYISAHEESDTPQYPETLSDIERNISELQNRLLDDNTIIQKGMTPPVEQGEHSSSSASTSLDLSGQLQDVLYDCSAMELKLITQTAQAIKDCVRNMVEQ